MTETARAPERDPRVRDGDAAREKGWRVSGSRETRGRARRTSGKRTARTHSTYADMQRVSAVAAASCARLATGLEARARPDMGGRARGRALRNLPEKGSAKGVSRRKIVPNWALDATALTRAARQATSFRRLGSAIDRDIRAHSEWRAPPDGSAFHETRPDRLTVAVT